MKIIGACLLGALFGALITWMIMSKRETIPPPPSQSAASIIPPEPDLETDPFSRDSPPSDFGDPWDDPLEKKSGKWISVDGQFDVTLDERIFTIGKLPSWANVEQQSFQLWEPFRFLSGKGFYSLHFKGEPAKSLRLMRRDSVTSHYDDIFLYREGDHRANSRPPLPKSDPPKEIQVILSKLILIRKTDTASQAFSRIGLNNFQNLKYLDGDSRWGETRGVIDLGINNEWMARYCHSEKSGIVEMQIFRGLVTEYRETGETLEEIVYPHIYGDYFIESPSTFRKFQ